MQFTLFELLIRTSGGTDDTTPNKVVGFTRAFDGSANMLDYLYEGPHVPADKLEPNLNSGEPFDVVEWVSMFVKPHAPVTWRELAGFEFEKWGTNAWRIDRIGITGFSKGLQVALVPFDTAVDMYFGVKEPTSCTVSFIKRPEPDPPSLPTIPTAEATLSAEESRLVARLKAHLNAESAYYRRAVILGRDPSRIAVEFEKKPWDGVSSVLDHVEPYPLEVIGSLVAYPLADVPDPAGPPDALPAQKLVSFPVRGVFAEGKIGHCNVSEEIDETRFWRWEEHPIPVEAPEIAAATPVTPTPTPVDATPTPLPAGLVNIVNPTPAPDPTGLGAALAAITVANAFRDMSGRAETVDLLKKLSDNSVAIAEASKALGGGGAKAAGGGGGSPAGGSGATPTSGGARSPSPGTPRSVSEVNDLASGIRRQLPPAKANPLVDQLYQNVVDRTGTDEGTGTSGIGLSALAQLTQQEYLRRVGIPQAAIRAFTPASEGTLVAWAKEQAPPAGLVVVNWSHDGVAHYGHVRNGKMIGDAGHPVRSPQDVNQVVLHETAGWAQIGAGVVPPMNGHPEQPLSVQFTIGPDGTAFQHNDIAEECAHAKELNGRSVGIEFTNWGPFFVGQSGAAPLATGVKSVPVTDLQTGAAIDGSIVDDRERIPIRWLSGTKGNGTTGDYYVMPPAAQLEALALLVGWLTGGPLGAAIDTVPLWRQLQNHPDPAKGKRPDPYLFEMSQHPAWTPSWTGTPPSGVGGIFAHRQFSSHQDGAVQGLYTWLRLNREIAPSDAYQLLRTLITDDTLQVSVQVTFGGSTHSVHYVDVSAVLDVIL